MANSDFAARHVVVSGGDGVLGGAIRAALEARGATVHVPRRADVELTDEAGVVRWFAARPPIWASIHAAGGFHMAPVATTTLADLRAMHDRNVVTAFLCCREAVKSMRRAGGSVGVASPAGGGRIVNVIARPAIVPVGGMLAYSTSKAAVASMTQCLAAELTAEQILVNAVAPSLFDTPQNRKDMPGADHATWPKPAEIAETIVFLASPANTLTTGTLVPVYGRA